MLMVKFERIKDTKMFASYILLSLEIKIVKIPHKYKDIYTHKKRQQPEKK